MPISPSSGSQTSPLPSSGTTAERELELISKVELRLALASTPTQLQAQVSKYLPPLLLKLASPHASVRQKTIQACQHVSARLRNEVEVSVPVGRLVAQFREVGGQRGEAEEDSLRRFGLVFIGMGLARMSVTEAKEGRELLKSLLALPGSRMDGGVKEVEEKEKEEQGEGIKVKVREETMSLDTRLWIRGFYFLLKLLPTWDFPERGSKEDQQLKAELGLSHHETRFLARWLTKFLLCDSQAFILPNRASQDANFKPLPALPGLTMAERALMANWAAPWKESAKSAATFDMLVTQTKVAVAKFLFSDVFTDKERFIPAVIMGADASNLGLFRTADTMFKQCNFNLESEPSVMELYELFLGRKNVTDDSAEKKYAQMQDDAYKQCQRDNKETRLMLPAKPKLQIRILGLLAKSQMAMTKTDAILEIFDEQFKKATDLGLEATKLRTALFNFLNSASRRASEAAILTMAPTIVDGFQNYILDQTAGAGVSFKKSLSGPELEMRIKAYENIGTWAAMMDFGTYLRRPEDKEATKMDLVDFLFDKLRRDETSPEIQATIESALGRLLNRLATSPTDVFTSNLRDYLLKLMNTEVRLVNNPDPSEMVRSGMFVAVRFVNRCLPFDDCQARWMNLLAIVIGEIDGRQEIVEEGVKGLDPYWWSSLNSRQSRVDVLGFPKFEELMDCFFSGENGEKIIKEPGQLYRHALPSAVKFCRNILFREALQSTDFAVLIEEDWEKRLDALVATNDSTRSTIRSHLKKVKSCHLTTLFDAALAGMSLHLGKCADFAAQICSLVPDHIVGGMLDRVTIVKPTAVCEDLGIQMQAARLLGILASHPGYSKLDREELIEGTWIRIKGWQDVARQDMNPVRGLVLSVTFIITRQALRGTLVADDVNVPSFWKFVLDLVLESRENALRSASHMSLGQLMMCLEPSTLNKLDLQSEKVIGQLAKDAKKGEESAVIALGRFIRGLSGRLEASQETEKALTSLYALHDVKGSEVQFTVGEALSLAVAGWHSKATTADFDLDVPRPSRDVNEVMLGAILDKVIDDCKSTKPSLKKASAIWLLCLLQYVGDQSCMQSRLRQCQAAFAGLLSSRDEIVQETGSRGLSLVYEIGDKDLKNELVRDLVNSFTGSNAKLGGSVTSETELFDAGALPTGDGSVTTYKDILSLASEMGDPGLVYRFMNLASNNAIWTRRSAFGRFGVFLADSAYLLKNKNFYPKLYRYRFDPNPNVQRSMNDIWHALIKDSNAVIDQHFDAIIEDLLKSLVMGTEWRVRQASCAALAEVLQGRDIERYEKYLDEIWTKAFKVLDDIKETVRVAALSLCRTLTTLLTRGLEAGAGSTRGAEKMLSHTLPFLVRQLQSRAAKPVEEYTVNTTLEVIQKCPPRVLRAWASPLVETLLNSLSFLEPEAVNYIHMNAEKYGLTAEKLDNVRVSSVRSSPLIQAIERCLESLDEKRMPEAMATLGASFKFLIGLPSKVGLSSVLVSLAVRHNLKFRPYASQFAQLLREHLIDRNDTVTNAYCLALAYVLRIATDKEIEETARFAKNLYFASEEVGHRQVAGEIVHAISKVSNDRFMAFGSAFLPFAFIGRNDIDIGAREPFKKTWEENVGGSRTVSLYLVEVIDLAQHIDSPKWGVKHTIASAIADLISCLDTAIDHSYTLTQAATIWPLLEKALGGKSWDGKEVVVDSFPKFVKKAQVLWETKGDQMDQIALRQAKRTNPIYRRHSISALGEIVKTRGSPDLAHKVLTAMGDVVEEIFKSSEDRMDVDVDEASLNSEAKRDARYVPPWHWYS